MNDVGGAGEALTDLAADQVRLKELEEQIYGMVGRRFKITSYIELSRVLFEELQLPIVKQPNRALSGYYSTSSNVLHELSSMGHDVASRILDYRALLYLIRHKEGKHPRAKIGDKAEKPISVIEADKVGRRLSPEEKLMMTMLREDGGSEALTKTMERVGVNIDKVMERVGLMGNGNGETEMKPAVLPAEEKHIEASEGGIFDEEWGLANNFVLIDAASILYRAYHAMPKLTTPEGLPIGGVLGFCNILHKILILALLQSRVPPYVLVVFDSGGPLYRQTAFDPDYKADRAVTPEDLKPQFAIAQEAAMAFGALNVTAPESMEADDVIAAFATSAFEQVPDLKVTIVTSDKDLLQLIDEDVTVYDPFNSARMGPREVQEKYGVKPDQLLDYFSMVGDSADNVKGIPGIGPKMAQALLTTYESFENLWDRKAEINSVKTRTAIEQNFEKFLHARRLIRLESLFAIPPMEMMPKAHFEAGALEAFCSKYALKDLDRRIKQTLTNLDNSKQVEGQALEPLETEKHEANTNSLAAYLR